MGAVDSVEAEVGELVRRRGLDPVVDRSAMLRQCRKDGSLRGTKVSQVHWHHFEYGSMNSIGSDPDVLSCLMANGIRFTFHPGP